MTGLALHPRLPEQPADRWVAGMPLRRLHGNRSDAFQISGRCTRKPSQGFGAGGDDQEWPQAPDPPPLLAIKPPPAQVHHPARTALTPRTVLIPPPRPPQRAAYGLQPRAAL